MTFTYFDKIQNPFSNNRSVTSSIETWFDPERLFDKGQQISWSF